MSENDDKRHADFCERQFASELIRRSLSGNRKIGADEFVALCTELELGITDFIGSKVA